MEEPVLAALVVAEPVDRPLASRYSVRVEPLLVWLVEVPVILPEVSRVVDCTLPLAFVWRSMVWTILPDASRTTSRQFSAERSDELTARIADRRRIGFMWVLTVTGALSFIQNEVPRQVAVAFMVDEHSG